MSDSTLSTAGILKNRTALLAIAGILLIIIIWLLVFFIPQGNKLSKLDAKATTLQAQVQAGQAKVTLLKKEALNTPALEAISQQLTSYVPPDPGIYPYITTISNTANSAKVNIVSLAPGTPMAVPGTNFLSIGFTVAVSGTYDQFLSFIQGIYALPRLTQINTVSITGGGPQTSRSTTLNMTATLTIFTTAKPTSTAP